MGLRRWSIRMRIFLLVAIPILSLIGVYAFAATTAASSAINLSKSRSAYNTISLPTGLLQSALDTERVYAVTYLAAPAPQNLAALQALEHKTDQSVAAARAAAAAAAGNENAQEKQGFAALLADVTRLPALRSEIAARTIGRPQVVSAYGNMINQDIILETQLVLAGADVRIAGLGLAINRMGNVVSLLLQEDALLLGDTLSRSFSATDRQQLAELVGARRAMYAELFTDLDPPLQAIFARYVSPAVTGPLEAIEDRVIADPRPFRVPPVSPLALGSAVQRVSQAYSAASIGASVTLTDRAQPEARSTFLRLFLAGALGLVAVILSIFMSVWIGRGLVRQLSELRRSALELATKRLPSVMERLRAGQDVDVAAEAPPLETSADEIGQVTQAFNAVQRTAVEAAVDEAKLRRGVSDVFRNLARRSQSLLHRQLALLDTMERRASEPEELEDLYRIDHLTTRMRRHSEGLIILSGETPGRGWRHPVRLVDVLRGAVAEVEDYARIRVTIGTSAALIGPAVADVVHLIAELAENATIFSPPNAPVRIHGDMVGRGFAIEIEDRGLGIAEEKLAKINHDLEHPPEFDLSGSEQLGLFVAGQLARRHEIRVTLQPSPYGGITAIVLIPKALIVDDAEAAVLAASERASRLTGRPGSMHRGVIAEPAALAQLSASMSADGQPGAAAELPSGPSAELPPGPSAELPSAPAGELPPGPAGEPADPAADAPPASPSPFTVPVAEAGSVFTPRGPRTVAASSAAADGGAATVADSSFRLPGSGPQGYPADSDATDPRVSTAELTKLGLPVRVRQASLAPQLRDSSRLAADASAKTVPGAPSPEAARSTMTALQRGWERGRYISGAPVPSFDTAQSADPSTDGDERNDE
jgi:signal transduction histidine kinase